MANNIDTIVAFLRGKGLTDAQIAGVLGNLQVESGFNPEAYNAGEGAIGIAQWEGSRRTALQQYAAAHGGRETDLNIQLGFMWHELTGSESGAYARLQAANSAASAAAAWDQYYERSSGSSRSQRVNYATQIFGNGLTGAAPSNQGGGLAPESAGYTPLTAGAPGKNDYTDSLGILGQALDSIPELKALLQQAQANDWTVDKFINEVQDSKWYRTHSASIRQGLALQASDPATYKQNLSQSITHVQQIASRLGVNLTDEQAHSLGLSSYLQGLDDSTIAQQVGGLYLKGGKSTDGGESVTLTQQIRQLAHDYAVPVTADWVQHWVQKDLVAGNGVEGATEDLMKQAASLYPAYASDIQAGTTVRQIAQPYVASMSSLLEIPTESIHLQGPLIQQALTHKDSNGNVEPLPLWKWQDQVRLDPRWDKTDNARQSAYELLNQVGAAWGFSS